jgi:hypothetical protein
MSEDELNEALATINRRLASTEWPDRPATDGSTPATARDSAPAGSNRSIRFDDTADRRRLLDYEVRATGTGGSRAGQWGAEAASLSASPDHCRVPPASWNFQPSVDDAGRVVVASNDGFKRTLPTIKLESYNGLTPLETHLAKLHNCAEYYN